MGAVDAGAAAAVTGLWLCSHMRPTTMVLPDAIRARSKKSIRRRDIRHSPVTQLKARNATT